jgi:hypothetical protein
MTCVLAIASEDESVRVLGARYGAIKFRDRLTRQLESGDTVQVDFTGAFVTQSFVDELFGPLILRAGPSVLERLAFSGCSEDTRAILNLVFAGRLRDYSSLKARGVVSNGVLGEGAEGLAKSHTA